MEILNGKTTHLDAEIHRQLKQVALETDLSIAALVEIAVVRLLISYDPIGHSAEGHLTPSQLRSRRDQHQAPR